MRITDGPTGTVTGNDVEFRFQDSGGDVTVQCDLTGPGQTAGFETCYKSNAQPYTDLPDGPYTFSVRAVSTEFPTPPVTTRTFVVNEAGPPNTTITGGPTGLTNDAHADVHVHVDRAGLDLPVPRRGHGGFVACTSPHTIAAQTDGAKTFEVRAIDAAGAVDPTPAARAFTVDATAPNAPTIENAAAQRVDGHAVRQVRGGRDGGDPRGRGGRGLDHRRRERQLDARARERPGRLAHLHRAGPGRRGQPERGVRAAHRRRRHGPAARARGAGTERGDHRPESRVHASPPRSRRWNAGWTGPPGAGSYAACVSPKSFSALAPGEYVFFVRVTEPSGLQAETRRPFTVTQSAGLAQTPTPTPTPQPTPVPNQTIVVTPAKTGTVLVKEKGASKFEPLDVTKGIKNGSEVDVRNGRVTLTSIPKAGAPPETADFYGGMFIVTQKGGITDLKLSERLTGCPKGQQASLSLAQKKPKSRKLWGNGKGSFRTTGKYSAATVRGTIWLVQDSCTTTLTRVTAGRGPGQRLRQEEEAAGEEGQALHGEGQEALNDLVRLADALDVPSRRRGGGGRGARRRGGWGRGRGLSRRVR